MNKRVITKVDGQIFESERYKALSSRPYLCGSELCLGIEEYVSESTIASDKAKTVNSLIKHALSIVYATQNGKNALEELFIRLNEVKNPKELRDIFYLFLQAYDLYSSEKEKPITDVKMSRLIKNFEDDENLVLSVFVKKLSMLYFDYLLRCLDPSDVYLVESVKDSDTVFDCLGVSISDASKMNGMYRLSKLVVNDAINARVDSLKTHLCWEGCKNASPRLCPKMGNEAFANLEDFDFIRTGLKIVNPSGKCEKFYVTDCKNYCKEERKTSSYADRKAGMEFMALHYLDAGDMDEALSKHDYLLRSGKLVRKTHYNASEALIRKRYQK